MNSNANYPNSSKEIAAEFLCAELGNGAGPQSRGRAGLKGTMFWGGVAGCALTSQPPVSCRPHAWQPLPCVTAAWEVTSFLMPTVISWWFLYVRLFKFCFLWKGLGFSSSPCFRRALCLSRLLGHCSACFLARTPAGCFRKQQWSRRFASESIAWGLSVLQRCARCWGRSCVAVPLRLPGVGVSGPPLTPVARHRGESATQVGAHGSACAWRRTQARRLPF